MEDIILIGNGGHAKSVIDSIEDGQTYRIVGFIGTEVNSEFEYRSYKIIGTDNDLRRMYEMGVRNAFICIGYMGNSIIRESIYKKLIDMGFQVPTIIDPTAIIAKNVQIGEGTYIGKKSIINSASSIGKMVIINTAAVVEHDCDVGDFSHVAVNATLCGGVNIGSSCFVGASAVIIQGIKVERECVIGAGAVVVSDIDDKCVAVGVPAKIVKRNE